MKSLEKLLGISSIKPTDEQKRSMRQWFELQILTAALLGGKILRDGYEEIIKKGNLINPNDTKPALK